MEWVALLVLLRSAPCVPFEPNIQLFFAYVFNFHTSIAWQVARLPQRSQIVAICGENSRVQQSLKVVYNQPICSLKNEKVVDLFLI